MTVQELIDFLQGVEDKSKVVVLYPLHSGEYKPIIEVIEGPDDVTLYDY